jgi:hypothetical protein
MPKKALSNVHEQANYTEKKNTIRGLTTLFVQQGLCEN